MSLYIVTQHNIDATTTEVLSIFRANVDAIKFLHECGRSHLESAEVQIAGDARVEIIEKHIGWVKNTKTMKIVYEVKKFDSDNIKPASLTVVHGLPSTYYVEELPKKHVADDEVVEYSDGEDSTEEKSDR